MTNGKRILAIGAGFLAIMLIGYFGFMYPPADESDAGGTIGGVKKAEKYQSEQMSEKDVLLQDPEIQVLLQDDVFQKLLKDEELREQITESQNMDALELAYIDAKMSSKNMREAREAMMVFREALETRAYTGRRWRGQEPREALELLESFDADRVTEAVEAMEKIETDAREWSGQRFRGMSPREAMELMESLYIEGFQLIVQR